MSGEAGAPRRDAAGDGAVTIVTQTRVRAGCDAAFATWQEAMGRVVAARPGFLTQSCMPPAPPAQVDWVILQRFAGSAAAISWLNAPERLARVAEVQPLLVGRDDVHLVSDGASGVLPAPVSAVISTRLKPGQEAAYRAWEQRIATAQSKAPGFQGYRFEPPVPGVQEDWLSVLRFDSEAHLQAWFDSPERQALVKEAEAFTEEFHSRIVRTGFEQWFPVPQGTGPDAAGGAGAPPPWKQNLMVLLMLYPVVFLFGLLVQTPLLMARAHLPFAAALFIGNVASVLLLNLLLPRVSRLFGWWLAPQGGATRRVDALGAGLIVAAFVAMVAGFCFL